MGKGNGKLASSPSLITATTTTSSSPTLDSLTLLDTPSHSSLPPLSHRHLCPHTVATGYHASRVPIFVFWLFGPVIH